MGDENWAPIIAGFKAKYPFVKEVVTADLGGAEVFQKYLNEAATGSAPASLLVSGDPLSWNEFAASGGIEPYTSPELDKLPDFAQPEPGLYTFSCDPMLIGYNKALLPEGVDSISGLIDLASADNAKWARKITTYDIASTFGISVAWAWHRDRDADWKIADQLLPFVQAEGGSGTMVEKLTTGEYLASVFISSTVLLPSIESSAELLDWSYFADGTPMFLRGMGLVKDAPAPATAKLMLDYALSKDGQEAIYAGGFTPYREDVSVDRTYQSIAKEVGEDNLLLIDYNVPDAAEQSEFRARWAQAMGA